VRTFVGKADTALCFRTEARRPSARQVSDFIDRRGVEIAPIHTLGISHPPPRGSGSAITCATSFARSFMRVQIEGTIMVPSLLTKMMQNFPCRNLGWAICLYSP
jgi:hypothetical protein